MLHHIAQHTLLLLSCGQPAGLKCADATWGTKNLLVCGGGRGFAVTFLLKAFVKCLGGLGLKGPRSDICGRGCGAVLGEKNSNTKTVKKKKMKRLKYKEGRGK